MNDCERKLSNDLHAHIAEFKTFRELMDERDKRYAERDAGNKERVALAFTAAKEAAAETKEALTEYKKGANEWRDTVKDLIASLREALTTRQATGAGMEKLWGWIAFAIMAVIAALGLFLKK